MEEKLLVESLKSGSENAFKEIVHRYQEQVLNTCLGFVPNIQDAEDLSQEVFVEIYKSISGFKGQSKLSTWIYRIAVTKSLELIRYRKRKKRVGFFQAVSDEHFDSPDYFNHPGVLLENKERTQTLFKKIDELPENQRISFVLHKIEHMPHKEIAEIMNLSISAVESLLHRARKNLKKKLAYYYQASNIIT